jgi:hypothetical protein
MSWEFHSAIKLLLQRSVAPTGVDLYFLNDEDYKYNP